MLSILNLKQISELISDIIKMVPNAMTKKMQLYQQTWLNGDKCPE